MIWQLPPDKARLDDLVRDWLDDTRGQIHPDTAELYRMHFAAHLIPHFGGPEAITVLTIASYGRKRLKAVKRKTVQKERSALRGFLGWCVERGYLDASPEFPDLPVRAQGTPYAVRRRGKATELSPEESRKIVDALTEWSSARGSQRAFPIRDRFVVSRETALRPATLNKLSAPEHYSRGRETLTITDSIDKARFGRELPLSEAARAALDRVVPERGLIFGRHDYRKHLKRAAEKSLDPEKAKTFCAYDLRHARATEWGDSGDLMATAYMLGHRRPTTTAIYMKPGLRAARRLIEAQQDQAQAKKAEASARLVQRCVEAHRIQVLVPERVWRFKSSSSHNSANTRAFESSARSDDLLADESTETLAQSALALLDAAAAGVQIEVASLPAFGRAALELSDFGRLALEVADGGPHALRRALELAQILVGLLADRQREDGAGS